MAELGLMILHLLNSTHTLQAPVRKVKFELHGLGSNGLRQFECKKDSSYSIYSLQIAEMTGLSLY